MKIVIDTNVLIAAFLTRGMSHDVLKVLIKQQSAVVSPYILTEFKETLLSDKFGIPPGIVGEYLDYLTAYCHVIAETTSVEVAISDSSDLPILALCQTVKARFLITGDQELLSLKYLGKTAILNPGTFWRSRSPIDKKEQL